LLSYMKNIPLITHYTFFTDHSQVLGWSH